MNKRKLIPPFVMLAATAVVAVVTYLRDFPFSTWLIVVFGVMVLFLFFGELIAEMIDYFDRQNSEKSKAEEAARRVEEELTNSEKGSGEDNDPVTDLPPDE